MKNFGGKYMVDFFGGNVIYDFFNLLLLKNIAYIGSWTLDALCICHCHCLCVFVFL